MQIEAEPSGCLIVVILKEHVFIATKWKHLKNAKKIRTILAHRDNIPLLGIYFSNVYVTAIRTPNLRPTLLSKHVYRARFGVTGAHLPGAALELFTHLPD